MTFKNGHLKHGGRKKGSLNKTTAALKESILLAAQNVGDELSADGGNKGTIRYLEFLAKAEPVAFAGLLGKVLPLTLSGEGDQPMRVSVIELVALTPEGADGEQAAKAH